MFEDDDDNKSVALVPVPAPSHAPVPFKKKSSSELVLDLAKSDGNASLIAVLDRMTQLEAVNSSVKEVISAARDLEKNYTVPGEKRFKRVVRLRRALDELEDKVRKGRI